MTSNSSRTDPAPIALEDFARDIARRRAALDNPTLPRNAGTRRTASKEALLAAIKDAGGEW